MVLKIDFTIEELMRVAAAEGWPWHPGWNIILGPENNESPAQADGLESNSGGKLNSVKQINEAHSRNLPLGTEEGGDEWDATGGASAGLLDEPGYDEAGSGEGKLHCCEKGNNITDCAIRSN